jgi:uncharacterized protein (TIGR03118 family)
MASWIRNVSRLWRPARGRARARTCRLHLESLEDRCLLSNNVLQTNLVSDLQGVAAVTDPNLVNPWGVSESPTTPARAGSPFWISDNNSGLSTLYNVPGANNTPVSINPLVVSIPAPGADNANGNGGAPTGTVFNTSGGGFVLHGFAADGKTAASGAAIFLFATEDGTIVGWNPGVNPAGVSSTTAGKHGVIAVDNSAVPSADDGAVYKGLTIATGTTPILTGDANSASLLYAANFRAGTVDVFDTTFKQLTSADLTKGAFTDPHLPKGYAPFNVQVLNGKVYVTYALQNADKHDDVAGEGHGFVDVYNLDGTPGLADGKVRLLSRDALNSPWGLAIAPASFGSLAGALLVGNFGDGTIHAFDATTGDPMGKHDGELLDPDGEPIQIDGLWALKVGNDGNGGNSSTVYFTAGLAHETHGLFGALTSVAAGSPEGPAEGQTVQAALDVFQLNLATVQKDIANGVTGDQLKQDLKNLQTSLQDLNRVEHEFAEDVAQDAGIHPRGDDGDHGDNGDHGDDSGDAGHGSRQDTGGHGHHHQDHHRHHRRHTKGEGPLGKG